ncbi:FAD:protein FMN transferase [Echinicola strongylocentroti]|uniref:FAD:protein FMN transferase n=1 Tax=Echinicola strongylocentroti TaxID=1795355 RepID=A0A2Z4IJ22_9BACT|nr:FAD:protein FMN transferase [Echinicola strongylocentroti]AWW30536.1 FAD:protein FMN transferase [Echinicola strongylocentroti]
MHKNARKNIIYSIILLLVVFLVYLYRQNQQAPPPPEPEKDGKTTITGKTMGTSYRIVYMDELSRDFKPSVDSLLEVFNASLSTYIPSSELSRFNQGDTLAFESVYLPTILKTSYDVYKRTDGAFDPTVGPLVNAWGFGPDGAQLKDSVDVFQLLRFVGFEKINFDTEKVWKTQPEVYLDFSAIAKGYGVDVVAGYLEDQGIEDMLVEIGGELVARGTNENGELWKVGVNQPSEDVSSRDIFSIIGLDNKGMATSGNYRNFYYKDSVRYSHTINPKTGNPVNHTLLSATVLAEDCMTADAIATAMMVMGTEKAIDLQDSQDNIDAFLIYSDSLGVHTFVSDKLKPYVSYIKGEKE